MQHGNIFRIRLLLASECAADIGCPDPHLLARHAEDVLAQHAVEEVRPLAGGDQREAFVAGIVGADAAARLDRIGENPVIDKLQSRHMRGPGEGLLHRSAIAVTPGQGQVVRCLRPHHRGPFRDGTFDVRHGRQRLDLDPDFLASIDRLRDRFRDDHDDRLADMTHPVLGKRGTRRLGGRIHREPAKREIRDVADPGGAQVFSGHHGKHAGCVSRLAGIDGPDQPVSMTGTKKDRAGLAGHIDVVG